MKTLRNLIGGFIILACFMAAPLLAFASNTRIYHGIDVSQWQGNIDFDAVSESGIEIVYIRAGQGSGYTDPYFRSNYEGAKAAGLKIGFYHYVTAQNTAQAVQQADFFYSLIKDKTIDCRPAMDFESFPGLDNREINAIASPRLPIHRTPKIHLNPKIHLLLEIHLNREPPPFLILCSPETHYGAYPWNTGRLCRKSRR